MKKHAPSKARDEQPKLPLGSSPPPADAVEAAPPPVAVSSASAPPPAGSTPPAARPARRATAESLASGQREISVSEFFAKNRHLLGFDNPAKALLTTIKEAVDNSLDACEEAGILPDIVVEVTEINEGRYRVAVEDNGPGIVKQQVPKIFGKLLYGSKFHRLKQSRGQQGIGISAAGLYAQLTTGKPISIVSKTGAGRPARRYELRIDTRRNNPEVLVDQEVEWAPDHGTRVEMELAGTYRGGRTSIDAYLEQTIIANPHLKLTYLLPKATEPVVFERAADELPREPLEIKPHPHGVELGLLIRMMHESKGQSVKKTLIESFSRVSASVADQVCEEAGISPHAKASTLNGDQIEAVHKALGNVKVLAPPASCIVPIGVELIKAGMRRRYPDADLVEAVTRPPSVYRGNPFVIECGLAYGGKMPMDEQADVMRFANRVPLQYQPKACAMSEAVYQTNWKAYELQQPRGSLPIGPLAVFLHLASVWVPFTSEAKEAVAHYPELLKEMKLALQECGRYLAAHLRARSRAESNQRRRSIFERYIPEIGAAIGRITGAEAEAIAKHFLDALPQFVQVAVEEEPAADDGSGTGGPSMPPPADVVAEEPPESARGKSKKAKPAAPESEPPPASEPAPAAPVAKKAKVKQPEPEAPVKSKARKPDDTRPRGKTVPAPARIARRPARKNSRQVELR